MKLYSVLDKEFKEYGRVIDDDYSDILEVLKTKPCPENGVVYVPSDPDLEACKSFESIKMDRYGGMPIQIGFTNGHNQKLNCLEYHLDSEINVANEEFVLLLGLRSQIENGKFDTSLVKGFVCPKGVAVEVFATSLHYAPCGYNGNGYRVLVVLPKGTNCGDLHSDKEPMLRNTNKWLLAHKDSDEAKQGAYVGLVGENLEV